MSILVEIGKYMPEGALKVHCSCGSISFKYSPVYGDCVGCKKAFPKRYQFIPRYLGARLRYYKHKKKVIINE
jgi:hypothetical protein